MKRECRNCAKYQPQAINGGTCRAHPPFPVQFGHDKLGRPVFGSAWPPVDATQWCNEHEPAAAPMTLPDFDLLSIPLNESTQ
jgi:hypothetical protein